MGKLLQVTLPDLDALGKMLLESDAANKDRAELAKRLGVEVDVLQEYEVDFDNSLESKGAWQQLVVERKTIGVSTAANWDAIEEAATARLLEKVVSGKVSSVSELVGIARTANAAHRNGAHRPQSPQDPANALPAGDGVIRLSLTVQAAQALQNPSQIIDGEYSVIDTPKEIRRFVEDDEEAEAEAL